MNDDVVRARIPAGIKKRARVVLHKIGMTESDAFRMMMYRIVAEKQLPFAPLVPNQTTIEAMQEVRRGGLRRFDNAAEMLATLNDEEEDRQQIPVRAAARAAAKPARRPASRAARR